MFVTDALSRLHTKAQQYVYNMTTLNFPQHLNKVHIYHNYKHLAYSICKHTARQQAQINIKPKRGKPRITNCIQMVAKTSQTLKHLSNYKTHTQINCKDRNTLHISEAIISKTTRRNSIKSQITFTMPARNTLQDKFLRHSQQPHQT